MGNVWLIAHWFQQEVIQEGDEAPSLRQPGAKTKKSVTKKRQTFLFALFDIFIL
jgi:hypothetical protein